MKYDRDILVRLIIKKKPANFKYMAMRNQRTDFPVLNCAVSNIDDVYRAVIGARPGKAVIVMDENGILKAGITAETAEAFGEYVSKNITTGSNLRGSAKYRKQLAAVLTKRAVNAINKEVR